MPAIVGKELGVTYTGLQIAFGHAEKEFNISIEVFKFSFLSLLPYLLALGGITLALFAGLKNNSLFALIAGALFVVEGILLLLSVKVCVPALESEFLINAFKDGYTLAYGAIIGAIVAFIAGASSIVSAFVKK